MARNRRMELVFPASCRTDEEKVAWMFHVQERLRRGYNADIAAMSMPEAIGHYRGFFLPRSRALTRLIPAARLAVYGPCVDPFVAPSDAPRTAIRRKADADPDMAAINLTAAFRGNDVVAALPDPHEDLTDYTEVDAPNRLTVTPSTVTVTTLDNDENVNLYYDYGASHFGLAVSTDFEARCSGVSAAGQMLCICLSNVVNNGKYWYDNSSQAIYSRFFQSAGTKYIGLRIEDSSPEANNYSGFSTSTVYYFTLERDGETTMNLYIFTGSVGGTSVDTLTVSVPNGRRWEFNHVVNAWNSGSGGESTSGYVKDIDLHERANRPLVGGSLASGARLVTGGLIR